MLYQMDEPKAESVTLLSQEYFDLGAVLEMYIWPPW